MRFIPEASAPGVEREARNEKPPRLARTRNCLPHQKPPCVLVPAERQPEHIRKICESVHADMRDVPRNDDAVFDVLAPEPAVEAPRPASRNFPGGSLKDRPGKPTHGFPARTP